MEGITFIHFNWLFSLACEARDRAAEFEAQSSANQPGQALVAVVMSAASAEAFINEAALTVMNDLKRDHGLLPDAVKAFGAVLSEAVDANTELKIKYQLAATTLTGRPFRTGEPPFQDFANLVRLRNWLVHLKPVPPKVIADLEQRGMTFPRETYTSEGGQEKKAEMSPVSQVATSQVAKWACETASAMIVAVLEMFPNRIDDPMGAVKTTFWPYYSKVQRRCNPVAVNTTTEHLKGAQGLRRE
jgi:hypothetical protein